jgi:hypothetical protein
VTVSKFLIRVFGTWPMKSPIQLLGRTDPEAVNVLPGNMRLSFYVDCSNVIQVEQTCCGVLSHSFCGQQRSAPAEPEPNPERCLHVRRLTTAFQLPNHVRGEKNKARKAIVAEFDILVFYAQHFPTLSNSLCWMTLSAS